MTELIVSLVLVAPGGSTRFNPVIRLLTRLMRTPQVARWLIGPLARLYTLRHTRAALARARAVRRDPV